MIVSLLSPATASAARPIENCIPADAMVVYFSRPPAEPAAETGTSSVESIGRWLMTLKALGVIPEQGRALADIFGTLPMLSARNHAFVLLDITAKELRPRVYRLNDMRSALVVESAGIEVDIDRRVRDLLGTYTDARNASIQPVDAFGMRYFRLVDARLPEWAVTEWGNVDGYFVAGFGRGSFEAVLAAMRRRAADLGADAWYAPAHKTCSARATGIEVYVAIARIEKRLENVINRTAQSALHAVQLERADRLLVTIGFDGRALHSEAMLRERDGKDHHRILSGREVAEPAVLAAIPEQAASFAAFRIDLAAAIRQVRAAYLETQSPERRRRFSGLWTRLQAEFNFDVERGLFDQLGDHLIIHNFPAHPLGIPVLATFWIQIKGDGAEVTRTLNGMMTAWEHYTAEPPKKLGEILRFTPKIRHDPDGVWYLQLGLLGPALAVTDGWVVISYSPEAVRQNIAHLKAHSAR